MDQDRKITRRALGLTALSYSRIFGANERVRMGLIGLGGRGDRIHDMFLECADSEAAAVCDLRDDYMDFAARKSRGAPARYKDYRKLLDDRSIDAVMIATPDHWHALQFINACDAGKDVYVEKPVSLTVVEGRAMVEAAKRTRRIVQAGTQRRSSPMIREAVEHVRSGGIGRVTMARTFDIINEWPHGIGKHADEPAPKDFDWQQWLGPAPDVPYNRNRTFYKYRWFSDYSCGQLTNNGVHLLDIVRWCLDADAPRRVVAMGGKYAMEDNREIPDTLEVTWEFATPAVVTFSQINCNEAPGNAQGAEIELRGTKGTMYIHADHWQVLPERVAVYPRYAISPLDRANGKAKWSTAKQRVIPEKTGWGRALADAEHVRNFLDCVKSRKACNAGMLTGHLSTSTCIIANIALRTGRLLEWDSTRERFSNDADANRHLSYEYRAPYKLPST